jgi:hypothetical protein
VSPVRCKLGFYIPEDGILHSHRSEYLRSYITITGSFVALVLPEPCLHTDEFSCCTELATDGQ